MSLMNRRTFVNSVCLGSALAFQAKSYAIDIPGSDQRFLSLEQKLNAPVIVDSIEHLLVGDSIWFRVRDKNGAEGYCPGNDRLKATMDIAKQLVIPFFIGMDARQIESLVDDVYTVKDARGSVYKYAGMPFWNVVAHVEVAILDMLARKENVPVSQLLGGPKRTEIPVYISQFGRTTSAEEEVANAAKDLGRTGAKATKLKVGLRMANSDAQTRRDRKMIRLARKTFGEEVTIYVDANSSYTVAEAIEMGRFLDDHGVQFFEEPVPWQDYRGTKRVADALRPLNIKVAGGEQDSSLWQWREMVDQRTVDIAQPDVFYNGGLIRTLRVAKMAEAAGLPVTPHSPKVLPVAAANLHLCSLLPNIGPFQEYRSYGQVTKGMVSVPQGPGLGIEVDERVVNAEEL